MLDGNLCLVVVTRWLSPLCVRPTRRFAESLKKTKFSQTNLPMPTGTEAPNNQNRPKNAAFGSQPPSPDEKNPSFKPQVWMVNTTSYIAQKACFQGLVHHVLWQFLSPFYMFALCYFREKHSLSPDAGVDQNFQKKLGAIGPYEFQGSSYGPMALLPCFQGICMDQWPLKLIKSSPETGMGPWMALPSIWPKKSQHVIDACCWLKRTPNPNEVAWFREGEVLGHRPKTPLRFLLYGF